MSVRQHTYEEEPRNDGKSLTEKINKRASAEGLALSGLISTNEATCQQIVNGGDTTDDLFCNPVNNRCIVVFAYSFSRA